MRSNVTLAKKGTIIVTVLLALELLLLGSVSYLLAQAERESDRYEQTTAVIAKGNSLLRFLYQGAYNLGLYAATQQPVFATRYDETVKELPQELKALSDMIKDDPPGAERIRRVGIILADGMEQLSIYKNQISTNGDVSLVPLRKKMIPKLGQLIKELSKFTEEERDIAKKDNPQYRHFLRKLLHTGLACFLILNVFAAIMIMRAFTKGIVQRIGVLTDNTVRLASNAPLKEALEGNDEIAELDHVFHYMAEQLSIASRKEREATKTLKASEERVRAIIEHMPVGLIEIKNEGTITSSNPRIEHIFGFKQSELTGQSINTLFVEKYADDAGTFMSTMKEKALGRVIELNAKHKSGTVFPVELSLNEFQTEEGNLLLASIQDVTERHEVERLKREFVAMVSHDLRTPLTSVSGSLTLLSSGALGSLSADAQEVVDTAETEIERLSKLVSDLLEVAKLESGQMQMHIDVSKLDPVIQRSMASVSQFAEHHKVTLQADQTDALVMADPERLVQVMINLLTNAIKYSNEAGRVTVGVKPVGNWIEVRVKDDGRGIPAEHHQAIFERFRQVEESDAKEKGGTGLGLPICKTIIEQHQGMIGVESEVGKGSTFWFRVPLAVSLANSGTEGGKDEGGKDEGVKDEGVKDEGVKDDLVMETHASEQRIHKPS